MTSEYFMKTIGRRTLDYVESVSEYPMERKSIREAFINNWDKLLNSSVAKEIIDIGVSEVAKPLEKKLENEIKERKEEYENELKRKTDKLNSSQEIIKKREKRSYESLLEQDEELFSQSISDGDVSKTESESASTSQTSNLADDH